MQRVRLTVLLFGLIALTVSYALGVLPMRTLAATTYHVATTGSDTNDGSAERPFRTIQKAADVAQAGATVIVRPGVYYERFVRFRNSGAQDAPIIFKAEPGAIIDHGLRVPEWAPDGGSVYRGTPIFPSADDRKEWTNRVVVDRRPLARAESRSAMSEGTFFVDTASGAVYVWAFGGVNPTTKETLVLNSQDAPNYYQPGIKVEPSAKHIVLDGFTQRAANTAIEAGAWQSSDIGADITIKNCTLEFSWQYGVRFNWWNGATIDNCTVQQSGLTNWPRGTSGWPHAIIGWNGDNVKVLNSRVHDNHGEGVGPFTDSDNWEIRNNVVHDNYSVNIYIDTSGDNAVVDNNLVYNDPSKYVEGKQDSNADNRKNNNPDGIRVGNEGADISRDDPTPAVSNVSITNNVVIGTGGGIMSFRYVDGAYYLKDSLIANNTVINTVRGSLGDPALAVNHAENVRVVNNIVYPSPIYLDNGQGAGIIAQNNLVKDANQVRTGNGATVNGTLYGDPRLTSGAGFDAANYALRADSPARDAGQTIPAAARDFVGVTRPRGAAYDIGAFEFDTQPADGVTPTAAPPTATPKPGVFLPLISKLTLFNAATDQPIGELKDGATLDLKQLGTNQLSVVATTNPTKVGSVTFALDGQVIQTENFVPYSIKGDAPKQGGRNYMPWTPTAGTHTLVVTPYSQAKGQGQAGTPMTVRFTVGSMTTSPRATSAPSATVTPTNPPATATPQGGATGATYYVSGNGNDTDTGRSETQAFRTLQKAADQTQPGDTVLVMNGEYTYPDPNNNILTINRSGTPDKWITYAAYPGHTPKLKSRNWQAISVQGVGYIVIEGFTIEGNRDEITYEEALAQKDNLNSPLTAGNCIGVSTVYNDPNKRSHHIMIRKNTVSKCPGAGIYTNHADYITIEDNVVYDNAFYSPYATSGISNYQNWNSDQSTGVKMIIRRNVIYRNQNLVPFYYSNSDPNKRNITDGNGIIIDDGRNTQDFSGNKGRPYTGRTLIENNLVYENGGRGIHVFLSDNVDIINNTTYRNSAHPDIKEGEITAIWADDVRVYNNIISARSDRPANMIAGTPGTPAGSETITFDYNLVYSGTGFTSDQPNNKVGVDPQFVDVDARDFTLQPESPAIDAGSSDPAAPDDLAGARRPQGKGVDIGAYEAR